MVSAIVIAVALAGATPVDPPVEPPAQSVSEQAAPGAKPGETENAKPKKPRCWYEPVMGSRVRKQRVCDTEAYREAGENASRELTDSINRQGTQGQGIFANPNGPG